MLTIKQDNVLNDLKSYPVKHFHTIYCDPPYNLSTEWTISKNGNPVVKNKSKDFMGKWEGLDEIALEELFNEFFRVTKHGSYVVMYGLDRQLFAFNYYAMKAGFEITQSLHWFFISSFPKATDLSKQLDKRLGCDREVIGKTMGKGGENLNIISRENKNDSVDAKGCGAYGINTKQVDIEITAPDLAKQYDGMKYSRTPFKQCSEQIMVFRKPAKVSILDDIINNDLECSPSCINIDGGRVPTDEIITNHSRGSDSAKSKGIYGDSKEQETHQTKGQQLGRYPATVFIDSVMAEKLNNQNNQYFNTGGCSRVLHHCDYEDGEYDLLNYFSKVSGKERNAGLSEFDLSNNPKEGINKRLTVGGGRDIHIPRENNHPTLKPISLNEKILTLFKLPIPDQKLYIPFAGVFSEAIGAHKAGFEDITVCEMNPEYIEIGKARYNHWMDKVDKSIIELDETNEESDLY